MMFAAVEYHRMDEEQRALLVAKARFVFGVAVMVLAAAGELPGLVERAGEFLGLVGIIATGLALAIALLVGATRRQAHRIATGAERGNTVLDDLSRKHDETNAKMDAALGKQDEAKTVLDRQTRVLEDIRDLLRGRDHEPA